MNNDDKEILEYKGKLKYQFLRMKTGIFEVMHQRKAQKIVITYLIRLHCSGFCSMPLSSLILILL